MCLLCSNILLKLYIHDALACGKYTYEVSRCRSRTIHIHQSPQGQYQYLFTPFDFLALKDDCLQIF